MNRSRPTHRPLLAVPLVAVLAASMLAVLPSSAAPGPQSTTTPQASALPSGPPPPADFKATLKRVYAQAASYGGLPGVGPSGSVGPTGTPMSTQAFTQL